MGWFWNSGDEGEQTDQEVCFGFASVVAVE